MTMTSLWLDDRANRPTAPSPLLEADRHADVVVVGAGITVVAVALNMAAGKDVAARDKGVAYGLFETSTHVSGALVVAILATVVAARSGAAGGAAAGYRLAVLVAAAAAIVGGLLADTLGRRTAASAETVRNDAPALATPGSEPGA